MNDRKLRCSCGQPADYRTQEDGGLCKGCEGASLYGVGYDGMGAQQPRKYRTIVADPPWAYEGFASQPGDPCRMDRVVRVTDLPYQSLDLEAIKALPVASLADADCRLFLWTTNRYLPDAFDVLAAWGFRYRQTLIWHKTGNPSPFGGTVSPIHAEFLLVAHRGSPAVVERTTSSVIAAPKPYKHSRKPDVFIDLVERVSLGPYVELFARRARFGWDYWGDESLGTATMEAVA